MANTDSTVTSGKVFTPPAWKPNARKSQEENISSFLLYFSDVTKQMNNHMDLLQQGTSKMERKMEEGEQSSKRQREVESDERERKVIVFELDSEEDKAEIEEEGESEEEGETEEDDETDEQPESNLNSDLETESEEDALELDALFESDSGFDFGNYFDNDDDDDDDVGSDSYFGNYYEEN
ncbi:glutamic acid-rich protein-like [Chenopodium quinoa]|uniref:glutamic acid-rich protein-like n=1 Tax=Chenopodium quinoa TaxID=63459 RepID=UPI000B78CED3|nr:glutamic acid-rich protein-like [Chenopodium quinoa]